MMMLTKTVKVKLVARNIGHFEKLGYKIPRVKDSQYRMVVPKNTEIEVKVDHLNQGSNFLVEVKCDYCDNLLTMKYKEWLKHRNNSSIKKDSCVKCRKYKTMESNVLKYGVTSVAKLDLLREKASKSQRLSVNKVRSLFSDRGYITLFKDEDYKNNRSKLKYRCPKHLDQIQTIDYHSLSKGSGCRQCGYEISASKTRTNQKQVFNDLMKEQLFPLRNEIYKSNQTPILYVCPKHSEYTQTIRYSNFKNGDRCRYCGIEAKSGSNSYNWKGGITPIQLYLRGKILSWKADSIKACGSKCVITQKKFDDVHHLYSFHLIVSEAFQKLDFEIKEKVEDFTQEELNALSKTCLELHYKYPLGVCVSNDIHILFHTVYGYGNNTPDQFEEFKVRYNSGEFKQSEDKTEDTNYVMDILEWFETLPLIESR